MSHIREASKAHRTQEAERAEEAEPIGGSQIQQDLVAAQAEEGGPEWILGKFKGWGYYVSVCRTKMKQKSLAGGWRERGNAQRKWPIM